METSLRALNENNKIMMWAEIIADCRSSHLPVKTWCKENGVSPGTFYKWQKRLFALSQEQQSSRFTEVTQVRNFSATNEIAVTLYIDGGQVDIHNGADMATVEAIVRLLKSC